MSVWGRLLNPASLHAVADTVTGLALLAIAVALVRFFTKRRRNIRLGYLFAVVVTGSALTHFAAVYTQQAPAFGIELAIKLATACITAGAAVTVWVLFPTFVATSLSVRLAGRNAELAAVVDVRTAELQAANANLTRSIAESASAHQKMAQSEAQYRVSFEGATVGKVQSDPQTGIILRANPAFAAMLGYEPQELVGRNGWELVWPQDVAEEQTAFARVTSGELAAYVREKRFMRRDGTPVWARVSANVVRVPGSDLPDITVAVIENIDERRKAEAALDLTRRELEDVVVERTAALVHRDLLLREVYHRVKNNLQIVDSMLVMQAKPSPTPTPRAHWPACATASTPWAWCITN